MDSPWKAWGTRLNLKIPEDEDWCDSSESESDSIQLNHKDLPLYGQCPAVDKFFCIQCSQCSKIIKPSELLKHTETNHPSAGSSSTKSLELKESEPPPPPQVKKPLVLEKKSTHQHSRQKTVTVKKYSSSTTGPTKLKLTTTTTTKELRKKPKVARTQQQQPQQQEEQPVCDLEETLGWRPTSIGSSATTTISLPSSSTANGFDIPGPSDPKRPTKSEYSAPPARKKFLPCKDRKYDPNEHCGVITAESDKPCTRSLTCKSHSLSLRRAVTGRAVTFDELLAKRKSKASSNNTSSSSSSHTKSSAASRRTSHSDIINPLIYKNVHHLNIPDCKSSLERHQYNKETRTAGEVFSRHLSPPPQTSVKVPHESLANLAAVNSAIAAATAANVAVTAASATPPTQPCPVLDSHDQTEIFQTCIQMALNNSEVIKDSPDSPDEEVFVDYSPEDLAVEVIDDDEMPPNQTLPAYLEAAHMTAGPSGSYPTFQEISENSNISLSEDIEDNSNLPLRPPPPPLPSSPPPVTPPPPPPPPLLLMHDPAEFQETVDSDRIEKPLSPSEELDLEHQLTARPAAVNTWNNRLLGSSLTWATQWTRYNNLSELHEDRNGMEVGDREGLPPLKRRKLSTETDDESTKITRHLLMCDTLNLARYK